MADAYQSVVGPTGRGITAEETAGHAADLLEIETGAKVTMVAR